MNFIPLCLVLLGISQVDCNLKKICITGTEGTPCQLPNITFAQISDLKNYSDSINIQIYLSGGYHQLENNLIFEQKDQCLKINGSAGSHHTIIECNQKGLQFTGKDSNIMISHVTFHNCSLDHNKNSKKYTAALNFEAVTYVLYRVVIIFTKRIGL